MFEYKQLVVMTRQFHSLQSIFIYVNNKSYSFHFFLYSLWRKHFCWAEKAIRLSYYVVNVRLLFYTPLLFLFMSLVMYFCKTLYTDFLLIDMFILNRDLSYIAVQFNILCSISSIYDHTKPTKEYWADVSHSPDHSKKVSFSSNLSKRSCRWRKIFRNSEKRYFKYQKPLKALPGSTREELLKVLNFTQLLFSYKLFLRVSLKN
jgi:hypothetical protein